MLAASDEFDKLADAGVRSDAAIELVIRSNTAIELVIPIINSNKIQKSEFTPVNLAARRRACEPERQSACRTIDVFTAVAEFNSLADRPIVQVR